MPGAKEGLSFLWERQLLLFLEEQKLLARGIREEYSPLQGPVSQGRALDAMICDEGTGSNGT